MRDSETIEKARRALGGQLAAYRHAAGYSQATFASLINYSRSTIANVETGRQRVPQKFWRNADAALDARRELIEASSNLEAAVRCERKQAARQLHDASQPFPDAWRVLEHMFGFPVQQLLAPASEQEHATGYVSRAPEFAEIDDMNRRELLRIMSMGAPSALLRRPSRVLEALQTATSDNVADLDAIEDGLSDLIAHYSHVVAMTPFVYDDLLSVRSFVNSLLGQGGHTRKGRRTDLVVAAGWLSSLLAISATDMGEHAAALVWCSDTERRGKEGGQPELLGWAALTRALIAYYQGQAHGSVGLACRGQEITPIGTVAHAKLAAQEMRARAMLGDTDGMARAKRLAATAMERLAPDAATTGAFSIPCAEDPPYTATSLLLVKRYQDAAETTRRVIETVYCPESRNPGDQPTKYARTLLILGLAEAGLGRIDEASAAGSAALVCGQLVWPTMVLAGRLDHVLAESSAKTAHTADYHAHYLDVTKRLAQPAGRSRIT